MTQRATKDRLRGIILEALIYCEKEGLHKPHDLALVAAARLASSTSVKVTRRNATKAWKDWDATRPEWRAFERIGEDGQKGAYQAALSNWRDREPCKYPLT